MTTAEASPEPLAKRVHSHRSESRDRRRARYQAKGNGKTDNPYSIPLWKWPLERSHHISVPR